MNDAVKILAGFIGGGIIGIVIGHKTAIRELNNHVDEVEADRERIRKALRDEREKRRNLVKQMESDADDRLKNQGIEVKSVPVDEDKCCYPPSVISEESFRQDMCYIDYYVLTYFAKDGVLADESDERIISPVDKIGEEALDLLRRADQTAPIYVHNYAENVDFEIVINNTDTYAEYIGEYEEEEE